MSLPEYDLNLKLDYAALGERVDAFLVTCLEGGHYVSRSISFHDHSDLSLGELAALVLERGTDKYDPHQKEVAQKAFSGYNHYFHGTAFEVQAGKIVTDADWEYPSFFADTAYHFCEHALLIDARLCQGALPIPAESRLPVQRSDRSSAHAADPVLLRRGKPADEHRGDLRWGSHLSRLFAGSGRIRGQRMGPGAFHLADVAARPVPSRLQAANTGGGKMCCRNRKDLPII